MSPPAANPKILYRNSRLLRMVFLQLHRQQRADLFCDVVLQAEGEAVPAHCCILSACSPFFTERLEREMPPSGHKVVLEIGGLKIGTLRKLVDFLYTSEMEVSREEAQDVLAAARQLQVSELESLQLEGGKLVKKSLGRRLNRDCLHLSSPLTIPAVSLMKSPPACGGRSLTSRPASNKQHTAMKLPCIKKMSSNGNIDQKDTKKQKPAALLSEDKEQMPEGSTVTAEPLKTKGKKHPAGMGNNILGNDERGDLHTEDGTGDKQATVSLQESKKIKLSRSKLGSPPFPVPCAIKDPGTVEYSKSSRFSRRLWRQKSLPIEEAEGAEDSCLHGFWSPPLPPKAAKSRKRNSSEPASCSDPPQKAGLIGRVKLRKLISGGCWEVVQESPAAQSTRAENIGCAMKDEGSQSPLRRPEQEVGDAQQPATSTRLLPTKMEVPPLSEKNLVGQADSKVALDEGDHYKLNVFMLDHLAEDEQYDKLASAGELEHMLDLLLADDDVIGESQGANAPECTNSSCPVPGENKSPLESARAEKKDRCSAEVPVCPQWVKTENSPLKGELEALDLKINRETHGSANGGPLLDPVLGYLPFVTSETSSDCLTLYRPASLQLDGWTAQYQLSASENGSAKLGEPLPITLTGAEDQEFLSFEMGTSAAETQLHTRAMLRSPLQHNLDCELAPSLKEEEIDVGGVEELFVCIECVRPDPSPVSETEVDVMS
ncbi:BTB/POZ domain-containing protein 18 isoform X2 [Rhineura floridana]|nr:BTB/POZ domain-containing protein 18 isoform X2 [Rhineura floridana]